MHSSQTAAPAAAPARTAGSAQKGRRVDAAVSGTRHGGKRSMRLLPTLPTAAPQPAPHQITCVRAARLHSWAPMPRATTDTGPSQGSQLPWPPLGAAPPPPGVAHRRQQPQERYHRVMIRSRYRMYLRGRFRGRQGGAESWSGQAASWQVGTRGERGVGGTDPPIGEGCQHTDSCTAAHAVRAAHAGLAVLTLRASPA